MKTHRWVASVIYPALVQVNEDNVLQWKTVENVHPMQLPKSFICFDCERPVQEVFGKPCEAPKDENLSDMFWSML